MAIRSLICIIFAAFCSHSTGSSLVAGKAGFSLNGEPFRIMSGSIHYFRIPRLYWKDRMQKLKDCGLNTVETYVAWNLHEKRPGNFDFTGQLDLEAFIDLAQQLGLYVIIRPGPYICAEWEFGGLPAWLLSDEQMRVRSSYPGFLEPVRNFFSVLLPKLAGKQISNGGPIIAFQIENEYYAYGADVEYLRALKDMYTGMGLVELFFVSDGPKDLIKLNTSDILPDVLATVNEQRHIEEGLNVLQKFQPDKPLFVAEYWTGWYDQWAERWHHTFELETFERTFQIILERNASFNLYMFVGGTNFGFTNGANIGEGSAYNPVITSYDYDALLTENGQLTPKYHLAQDMIRKYTNQSVRLNVGNLNHPPEQEIVLNCSHYSLLTDILSAMKPIGRIEKPSFVEYICKEIGGDCSAPLDGFVVYRNQIPADCESLAISGMIADRMQILVNGRTTATLFNRTNYMQWNIDLRLNKGVEPSFDKTAQARDLILLVENMGRAHYTVLDDQRKGFQGSVKCRMDDGKFKDITDWAIYGLGFDDPSLFRDVVKHNYEREKLLQPAFYHFGTNFDNRDVGRDYFLDFKVWNKGVAFVNNVNLGRYWNVGPQTTLYLPGPLLNPGRNEIIMFELHEPINEAVVKLQDKPDWK